MPTSQILKRLNSKGTFAAFRHYNFRLWFVGQSVSLVGTWVQNTAQGYLIYELTRDPVYLGYVGFALGAPSWFLTLFAGVIADRISRRWMITVCQGMMMVLAFILAGLVFSDRVEAWHIILLSFGQGIALAFDAPARHAFVVDMVGHEELSNAIALNSTIYNTALVVGPAIGGIIYALVGPAWCFLLNGISFLAIIILLWFMHLQAARPVIHSHSAIWELLEGFRYVRSDRVIRTILLSLVVAGLCGFGIVNLMPAWAVDVLGGDVRTNGFLLSGRGVGALIGSLFIAAWGQRKTLGKLLTAGSFVFPLSMLVFSVLHWLPLSVILLVGVGWGFIIFLNGCNVIVQGRVPDELRGRVMSIYILTLLGGFPLSALAIGWLASRLGEATAIALVAVVMLLYSLTLFVRAPYFRQSG